MYLPAGSYLTDILMRINSLRPRLSLVVVLGLAACTRADRSPVAWKDPSPHQVSRVTVAPDVSLEVLDWGGTGTPLVFLSGLQDVAHGFDDFAPRFTDTHHVVAITRRGYGASSQPSSGYDVGTRVADLRAVLDSLGLARVVLAGHSIAGDELTAFAGEYPDRVAGLVYLDAAYDHSGLDTLLTGFPAPPPMTAVDSSSPEAVQAYNKRFFGMRIPVAQFRAIGVYDSTGHLRANVTPPEIDGQMLAGCGHPDYSRVRTPALIIAATVDSAPQLFPVWNSYAPASQDSARAFVALLNGWAAPQRERLRKEWPQAQWLVLPGANHYVFDSNEKQVEDAIRNFLAGS